MQIGLLGLGKMGSRIVLKLIEGSHQVVVWNRSSASSEALKLKVQSEKLKVSESIEELVKSLKTPRVIWLMLPAGPATEFVLSDVVQYLFPGDIVIDGGNSHFKDTQRRSEELGARGVRMLGIGVSGGVHALSNGYPLMVGGDKSAYEEIIPILDTLSRPRGGHTYFGTGGAGHFVKMVHNGIEYGMMQAIGEGFGVLEKAPYRLDLLEVSKLFMRSTIVSGFLIDRAKDALEKDNKLSESDGVISASGEGEWTVEQGKEEGVSVENIEQSLNFRIRSQHDVQVQHSFAARMVNALRREFGGHSIQKVELDK